MTPLAASAMTEVRSLHAAFEDLFTGRRRDLDRCARAFASDFSMVAPDGSRRDRGAVLAALGIAAASPDFHISIKDLTPIWEAADSVLLQYVEEQYRDGETTRRLAVALFETASHAPNGVAWRFLQETWIS